MTPPGNKKKARRKAGLFVFLERRTGLEGFSRTGILALQTPGAGSGSGGHSFRGTMAETENTRDRKSTNGKAVRLLKSVGSLEWAGIGAVVGAVIVQCALPWPIALPLFIPLVGKTIIATFLGVLAAATALHMVYLWVSQKGSWSTAAWGRALRSSRIGEKAFWTDLCWIVATLWLVLAVHFTVKVSVHLLNPRVLDAWLWRYDEILGFGHYPASVAAAWVRAPWCLHFLDVTYSTVYPLIYVLYPPLLVVATPARGHRRAFAAAFCFIWIVGAALYAALPSWGPVFTKPQYFELALQHMPTTVYVQKELFTELKSVLDHPLGPRSIRFGGVAAFPSLHLAVITLFALASVKVSRSWFWANAFIAAAMLLASLVTGYHYLFDGIVGIIVGYLCYRLACRWEQHTSN